jgi:hypothetical protein
MIMTLSWAGVVRAGEGNRTLMTSLEDREQETGVSRTDACADQGHAVPVTDRY